MFPKRKKEKVYAFTKKEVLLNNIVDKDFQRYLLPLNLLQSMFVYPKYRIRDNFITPNGRAVNVLSFIATCIYVFAIIFRAFIYNSGRIIIFSQRKSETVFVGTRYINFSLNMAGHLVNFVANASHSSSNVLLVLKIQDVYRKLRFHEKKFDRDTIVNWISGGFIFVAFYVFYGYVDTGRGRIKWADYLADCALLSFLVNMLYSTRIIVLMKDNLSAWTREIESNKKKYVKEGEQYWKEMLHIYILILDSYNIYIKVFQGLILYFTTDAFLHTLAFVQSWLTYTQTISHDSTSQLFLTSAIILIITWILGRLLCVAVLGKVTEQFYIAMEETQTISSTLLAAPGCDEAERRMYKNVQRLYRACFTKVNLKGLITVDATLPLQLASVTTAYVIVILQFAFII